MMDEIHRCSEGRGCTQSMTLRHLGVILSPASSKAQFWERFAKAPLTKRQIEILNRLLDGFERKLIFSK